MRGNVVARGVRLTGDSGGMWRATYKLTLPRTLPSQSGLVCGTGEGGGSSATLYQNILPRLVNQAYKTVSTVVSVQDY